VLTPGGTGSGTLGYALTANPQLTARTATIQVAGQTLTVVQAGGTCAPAATPSAFLVSAGAGTGSVMVSAINGCAWTVSASAPWLTASSTGGSGNGTVSFSYPSNPGAPRVGGLLIGGAIVTVSQASIATAAPAAPRNVRVWTGI
jgi:hypothetical protein